MRLESKFFKSKEVIQRMKPSIKELWIKFESETHFEGCFSFSKACWYERYSLKEINAFLHTIGKEISPDEWSLLLKYVR